MERRDTAVACSVNIGASGQKKVNHIRIPISCRIAEWRDPFIITVVSEGSVIKKHSCNFKLLVTCSCPEGRGSILRHCIDLCACVQQDRYEPTVTLSSCYMKNIASTNDGQVHLSAVLNENFDCSG